MMLLRCARLAVRGCQSRPLRRGHDGGATSRCEEDVMKCGARVPCIRYWLGHLWLRGAQTSATHILKCAGSTSGGAAS